VLVAACLSLLGSFILLPQLRVWTVPRRRQPVEEAD
jgi:hypothetical protein